MADPAADPPETRRGGVFREWVLPIGVGLLLGWGLVQAWKRRDELGLSFGGRADRIVARWEVGGFDENEKLAEELRAMGRESREDLLEAFRDLEVPEDVWYEPEQKVWVAQLLASEPWLDARSLVEIVRDPKAPKWDRRCAAVALVRVLRKDVDPTLVAPVLLEWIEDRTLHDHSLPMDAAQTLRAENVFPPQLEDRLRAALLVLVARRPVPADEERALQVEVDRDKAVWRIATMIAHDDVKAALWGIAHDEEDLSRTRSNALQTLAANAQFDDVEAWRKAAASKDPVVRQTVADNLFRTHRAEYDAVLAPLHEDAASLTRSGSIATQNRRMRPTALGPMAILVADHAPEVRREAFLAIGTFRDHVEGMGARMGMALHALATSDVDSDLEGALIALHRLSDGKAFGFEPADIEVGVEHVREDAIAAFKSDVEGRAQAVRKWREHLPQAVWTDADRKKAFEALLRHADPENREHAARELEKLKAPE